MSQESRYHVDAQRMKEETLIIREAIQDPAAFAPLYSRYFEGIFRFVYQRMDDINPAKDITQQVFVKALQKLNQYRDKGLPFSSWLYRIAWNELNQYFRNNSKHRMLNLESAGMEEMMEEMEEDRYSEYSDKLANALLQLDPDSINLIEMRFFEKRSFREIAEITDMTENNAKVKIYRLLDKIRAILTKAA